MYCDVSLDEDGAAVTRAFFFVVLTSACCTDESYFVCHKVGHRRVQLTRRSLVHAQGYISLFPLLLGLVPPSSPRLLALLDLLHDPDQLWSDYGLRSLSLRHPLFGQGEDYWRGAIWIPMNYMALQSLHSVRRPSLRIVYGHERSRTGLRESRRSASHAGGGDL
jgi:hypothetical protein